MTPRKTSNCNTTGGPATYLASVCRLLRDHQPTFVTDPLHPMRIPQFLDSTPGTGTKGSVVEDSRSTKVDACESSVTKGRANSLTCQPLLRAVWLNLDSTAGSSCSYSLQDPLAAPPAR